MSYLADTNVVFRRVLASDPWYSLVKSAVDLLLLRGETIYACAQNLIEFHALATRSVEANGLGMTCTDARDQARVIESVFPLLPDIAAIYPQWCSLIDAHDVTGRQVYDARLVAGILAHGITHLLTLNPAHFRRFSEVTVVEPAELALMHTSTTSKN
jgi:predicted nucleic acid-binding protein